MVVIMTALLVSATVPAYAAQQGKMTKEEKDMCLLISRNCEGEVDSIQKRIKRLQGEIKKGNKVYSPEELKKLEQKLKEANKILDTLLAP